MPSNAYQLNAIFNANMLLKATLFLVFGFAPTYCKDIARANGTANNWNSCHNVRPTTPAM